MVSDPNIAEQLCSMDLDCHMAYYGRFDTNKSNKVRKFLSDYWDCCCSGVTTRACRDAREGGTGPLWSGRRGGSGMGPSPIVSGMPEFLVEYGRKTPAPEAGAFGPGGGAPQAGVAMHREELCTKDLNCLDVYVGKDDPGKSARLRAFLNEYWYCCCSGARQGPCYYEGGTGPLWQQPAQTGTFTPMLGAAAVNVSPGAEAPANGKNGPFGLPMSMERIVMIASILGLVGLFFMEKK